MNQVEVTVNEAKKLGLTAQEFDMIVEILGRTPNFTELSIYSVMWSEHASYKNSIKWLKKLPREGKNLLLSAGEENAGMVDIGNGQACVFKIESHNHPSAIEPYQGAATGVGGINRDIFTMGARPIAQLNSLRFGNLKSNHTKWLIKGIVKGIGDYGNAFGVPVVGGEVFFDKSYQTNPLVNAMSVGIMQADDLISAIAKGEGNPVFIVGSRTGKDGIHGATFASADITENSADDIPSVQVGDPFAEKLLLEASLELKNSEAIVGMQDMGAAGIICSTSEMSEKGKSGMSIDLDKVPLRQENIEAWEILLSESQERMLVVGQKGKEAKIKAIFDKWDVLCVEIGEVTTDGLLHFYRHGEKVAQVPADTLVLGGGAPQYDRKYSEPKYFAETKKFKIAQIPEPNIEELKKIAIFIAEHPNNISKEWVTEQYDSMVRTNNMSTNAPSDAAIVTIKHSNKALALTTDCNARYVYANPEIGTQIAVAEAARNIACAGGIPQAITNCLNFGNPYNPEAYWQFIGAIKGMSKACLKFETPVTGGNVSFYNQTTINGKVEPIMPTPVIGMLGLLEDKMFQMDMSFKAKGDVIFLIGKSKNDINSSEYLVSYQGVKLSPPPYFNLDEEYNLNQSLQKLIRANLIVSAHDVSNGGLWLSLLESSLSHSLGFDITSDSDVRQDAFLFGESQSRVIVSVSPDKQAEFIDYMKSTEIKFLALGHVTKGELRVDNISFGFIEDFRKNYQNKLGELIEN